MNQRKHFQHSVRRWRSHRSQRGVAVILVMGAITIMAIMLSEMQDENAADLSSAISERDSLRAEYAARSAINLARLLIASEPTIRKTLTPLFMMMRQSPPQIPVWEFADQVLGAFGDAEGADRFKGLASVDMSQAKNLGLAGAGFEVSVIDEDSKLNLNLAARADAFSQGRSGSAILGLIGGTQYNSLFEERDADGQFTNRQDLCSAIVDWVDPNTDAFGCEPQVETATNYGPEDSFYQMLPDPYPRKNAAFDSLEELRLIRGVSENFWATFVEPNPDDPKSRPVTVWGQGATNVNTANAQALLAVVCANAPDAALCTDPEQALQFLSTVDLIKQFTAGAPTFTSPKAFIKAMQGQGSIGAVLSAIGVQPVQFRAESEALKTISTESKVFSIVATGYVKQAKRETRVQVQAVVDFRGAPEPLAALVNAAAALAGGAGGAGSTGTDPAAQAAQKAGDPAGLSQEGIGGALRPDPAGKVLYYRIN